jgi:transcription-repair coupling factor (superfamily II helicase)
VSERLATLWRLLQRELDVALLPGSTALAGDSRRRAFAGTTFHSQHTAR